MTTVTPTLFYSAKPSLSESLHYILFALQFNQNVEITSGSLIANSTTDYLGATNNLTIKHDGILDLSSEDKSINTVTLNNLTVDNSATNAHVR